jgi:hypothetical protein
MIRYVAARVIADAFAMTNDWPRARCRPRNCDWLNVRRIAEGFRRRDGRGWKSNAFKCRATLRIRRSPKLHLLRVAVGANVRRRSTGAAQRPSARAPLPTRQWAQRRSRWRFRRFRPLERTPGGPRGRKLSSGLRFEWTCRQSACFRPPPGRTPKYRVRCQRCVCLLEQREGVVELGLGHSLAEIEIKS